MKKGCSESEAGACMYRLLFFHSTIGLFKNEKLHGTSVFRFNICLKINDYKKTRLANISKKTKNRYNKLCFVSLHKNGKRNATVYCKCNCFYTSQFITKNEKKGTYMDRGNTFESISTDR